MAPDNRNIGERISILSQQQPIQVDRLKNEANMLITCYVPDIKSVSRFSKLREQIYQGKPSLY